MFESVTRYTRLVGMGKRMLWALAAGLTLLLLVVGWINGNDRAARITFTGAPKADAPPPEAAIMMKPHYQGVDDTNRPFTITASRAVQPDRNTVELENISADMMSEADAWLALTAGTGRYDLTTSHLSLNGDVQLFYEGGYEFRSDQAEVDVKKGEASGTKPVQGQGPAGILKANTFKILDRGAVLQFNGEVYVKLYH